MSSTTGQDQAERATKAQAARLVGWESLRGRFPVAVQDAVDKVAARGGVTVQDLLLVSLAEVLELRRLRSRCAPRERMQWTRATMTAMAQLRKLVLDLGGGSDPDAPVVIPDDVMDLLRTLEADYGVDLTA